MAHREWHCATSGLSNWARDGSMKRVSDFMQAHSMASRMGWTENTAYDLIGLSALALAADELETAGKLLGQLDKLAQNIHLSFLTYAERIRTDVELELRARTGRGQARCLPHRGRVTLDGRHYGARRLTGMTTAWRPPRLDRPPRARGRARARLRRGRPAPRGHRDRRPRGQGRRAGAPVREPQVRAPAADQPVRHRAADVPRLRAPTARRRRPAARRRARDAAAAGPRREGARPEEAEVDRRLAAEERP